MILEKPYHNLNIDNNIFKAQALKNIFLIINTSVARLSSVNVVKYRLSPYN